MAKANLASVPSSDKAEPDRNIHIISFGGDRRAFAVTFGEDPGNLQDQVIEIVQAARDLTHLANVDNPHARPIGCALDGIEILLGLACALDVEARAGDSA